MSTSFDDYIYYLSLIQKNLYAYGGPIVVILGTICCTISLLVFSQKKLRKNPCAMYLIAVNISNFLYIYLSILIVILALGYNIDLSSYNIIICRFIYYFSLLFDGLSSFYLILASIDRVLVTSVSALTRQRSTRRLAIASLTLGTIFWMVFHCHTFIFIIKQELAPGYFICYFQAGLYAALVGYYSTIIKGILTSLLLIIFGLWTRKNLRNIHHRQVAPPGATNMHPIGQNDTTVHLKNRQFALMLLMEILIYITFTSMLSIIGVYQQIAKNEAQTAFNYFIRIIGTFVSYTPIFANFLGNLFISKTFRSEVRRIFSCQ
ncbi:unnamed protein product [Adineta ricciae]|uniref:G-protein coupled receptors family 1 profile domain-containing protein n=1 Tax=Adineta ricciae TaxID=249248 RepID=A0A814GT56_ADIRI|nr:unnamed protein product [Adineta ricciae]CAF1154286.1 unnamed protein product [Adineta ricciae]